MSEDEAAQDLTPRPPLLAGEGEAIAPPDFAALLAHLRALAPPCLPPTGAGSFDILYACEREIVVWYSPLREGQEAREVIIPGTLLLAAWRTFIQAAQQARALDERELCALAGGKFGGRWLAALLAQLPGVQADLVTVAMSAPVAPPSANTTESDAGEVTPDPDASEANRELLSLRWLPMPSPMSSPMPSPMPTLGIEMPEHGRGTRA